MPPRIDLEEARDFTGGWNLATDAYNLADNEFPFVQNVDPSRRGGLTIRRGLREFFPVVAPVLNITGFHTFAITNGARHHLISGDNASPNGTLIYRWDGAAWVQVHAGFNSFGDTSFVAMNNVLYIVKDPGQAVRRWTGTGTAINIPQPGFHDDLQNPTGNTFIQAKVCCVHNGVMFAGDVREPATGIFHPSRLRWSHPGKPEDWRTNDWIDIDPDDDAGMIRGLVSFGDRLLVFKERALYSVSGFPPEGFSVTAITKEVGATKPFGIAATENVVYFWDVRIGLCQYDGKTVTWPFDRIYPLIDDGKLNMSQSWNTRVAFHNQRVWVGVPYQDPPYANKRISLVYAPDVGRGGAWTLHTASLGTMNILKPSDGGDQRLVGAGPTALTDSWLMELDVENFYEDRIDPSIGTTARIDAQIQTRWFDANNSALKKRWKRPVLVVGADANQEFKVDVFDDYNPSLVRRTFSVFTDVNGTEGVWDISNWDQVVWAGEVADRAQVLRGSPLGTGTAKALRFSNVLKGVDWRIHGVVMKWVPKRIRN